MITLLFFINFPSQFNIHKCCNISNKKKIQFYPLTGDPLELLPHFSAPLYGYLTHSYPSPVPINPLKLFFSIHQWLTCDQTLRSILSLHLTWPLTVIWHYSSLPPSWNASELLLQGIVLFSYLLLLISLLVSFYSSSWHLMLENCLLFSIVFFLYLLPEGSQSFPMTLDIIYMLPPPKIYISHLTFSMSLIRVFVYWICIHKGLIDTLNLASANCTLDFLFSLP